MENKDLAGKIEAGWSGGASQALEELQKRRQKRQAKKDPAARQAGTSRGAPRPAEAGKAAGQVKDLAGQTSGTAAKAGKLGGGKGGQLGGGAGSTPAGGTKDVKRLTQNRSDDTKLGDVKEVVDSATAGTKLGKRFGAPGMIVGTIAGAVAGLAKTKRGRWLIALIIAGNPATWLLILPLVLMLIIAPVTSDQANNENQSAAAVQESGFDTDQMNAYQGAVAGTRVPWQVLAAVELFQYQGAYDPAADQTAKPEDRKPDQPYGPFKVILDPANTLAGQYGYAPLTAAHVADYNASGASLARALEALVGEAGPGLDPANLIVGSVRAEKRGGVGLVLAPDPANQKLHTDMRNAWVQGMKRAPIANADQGAEWIVDTAVSLLLGDPVTCGPGETTAAGAGSVVVPAGAFVNPIPGPISVRQSGRYGWRIHPTLGTLRFHYGDDVGAASGTPIVAAADATVITAGDTLPDNSTCNPTACGNVVGIDVGGGVTIFQAHIDNGNVLVKVGDRVKAGQVIAKVGSSGFSTGPHAHTEVKLNNKTIDPNRFFAQRGVILGGGTKPNPTGPYADSPPQQNYPSAAAPAGTEAVPQGGSAPAGSADTAAAGLPAPAPAAPAPAPGGTAFTVPDKNGTARTITPTMQQVAAQIIGTIDSLQTPPDVTPELKLKLKQMTLMGALQESTMLDDKSAQRPDSNNDVGLMQQRSLLGWYADGATQEENVRILLDVPYQVRTFIEGHRVAKEYPEGAGPVGYVVPGIFQVRHWKTRPMGEVIQSVQGSAYPTFYDKWEPVAAEIMKRVSGVSVPGSSAGNPAVGGCQSPAPTPAGPVPPGPWGGFENGRIPDDKLCSLEFAPGRVRCDAAAALKRLNDDFEKQFVKKLQVPEPLGAYRTAEQSAACTLAKDPACVEPGEDVHGWALAVDLPQAKGDSPEAKWIAERASAAGWRQPTWATSPATPHPEHYEFWGSGPSPGSGGIATAGDPNDPAARGLQPDTLILLATIRKNFPQIKEIGGQRPDSIPDHPEGRALDNMVYSDRATGEALSKFLMDNAAALRVDYFMWYRQIWNPKRDAPGAMRPVADRGSPTQNHEDHVHVTVLRR